MPVQNEAWILQRTLACASLWADKIIIADQMSTDGSREIAREYPNVIIVDNATKGYCENIRIKLMVNEARKIPGKKLLIALDADEALSANFYKSDEWCFMLNSTPGTSFVFERVNILPDMENCWIESKKYNAVIDDGYEDSYSIIHGRPLPIRNIRKAKTLNEIKILHYQYTNWKKMKDKQRWYQVWHSLDKTAPSPIDMYRLYHPAEKVRPVEIVSLRKEWLQHYKDKKIDMESTSNASPTREREILEYFEKYGVDRFRKLDVWDVDWEKIAKNIGFKHQKPLRDPRNFFEKIIHYWLASSQKNQWGVCNKVIAKALRFLGW
jgi:glycosyltransferase involved in cell wall biosynthesis